MIQRQPNSDVPVDKLRLQASEKNSDWSKELFNSFIESIRQSDVKFYPNLSSFYDLIKNHYEVDHVVLGSGSDKCIEYFIQAHSGKYKNLIIPDPCFPMYFIYGMLYGYNIIKVPYTSLEFPTKEFLNLIDQDSIVIVSNPSSPIADVLSEEFLIELLSKNVPTLVDEAYIEFSDEKTLLPRISSYDNLFVTRTFSKAYGSAGVRLGIIASQKENIDLILQYRPMFEINGLTVKWIQALLNNLHEVNTYISDVKKTRDQVVQLCKDNNIEIVSGYGNWVHIRYKNQLPDGVFKTNCSLPNLGNDWIRLQITDNIKNYLWIK